MRLAVWYPPLWQVSKLNHASQYRIPSKNDGASANLLWVYPRRRDLWPFFRRKTVLKPFIWLTVQEICSKGPCMRPGSRSPIDLGNRPPLSPPAVHDEAIDARYQDCPLVPSGSGFSTQNERFECQWREISNFLNSTKRMGHKNSSMAV